MKRAVMYGAGNIGRGFVGQLFAEAGYEVVFVDVNDALVARLNADRAYPVRIVSNARTEEVLVEGVRAVDGRDAAAVAEAIGGADLMATAVGVNVLPRIAAPIAAGLSLRWSRPGARPLDVVICENLIDAHHHLFRLVQAALPEAERAALDARMGFVEASVGRMVPVMTPQMQEGNPLRVWVEPFKDLPVDRDAFRAPIPEIPHLLPRSPFPFYVQRKLFIHNMGHAMSAYLGQGRGYRYVWEAVEDAGIRSTCRAAMMESARALSAEHAVPLADIEAHVDDLLARFGNRQLGDTIDRVGRDLQRKLGPSDRLVGAIALCTRHAVEPRHVCEGLAAALRFRDPADGPVSALLREAGPEAVLERVCGLTRGSWAWSRTLEALRGRS